jgi:hypothetical protein
VLDVLVFELVTVVELDELVLPVLLEPEVEVEVCAQAGVAIVVAASNAAR